MTAPPSTDTPVAIITGGGSGIGLGIARALLREKVSVCLMGRTLSRLEEARQTLIAEGAGTEDQVMLCAGDLSAEGDAERAVDDTMQRWGRIDIVINNAGRADLVNLDQESRQHCRDVFETNVIGPMMLVKAAWPHFITTGRGTVINISSKAVFDPFPGFAAYAASKSALDSLTRTMINEAPQEMDFFACSIAPGAVETGMLRSMFDTSMLPTSATLHPDDLGEAIAQHALRQHPDANGQVLLKEQS